MEEIQKSFNHKFDQRELVLNKLTRIRQLASQIYKETLKQDYNKKKNEIIYTRTDYGNIHRLKYNLSLCENAYVAIAKHYEDSNTEMSLNKVFLLLKNINHT
jgi:hypothetical protein